MTEPRGSTATPEHGRPDSGRKGPIARIGLFYRQVVAELRKVVWPTRSELITYTTVVIIFVGLFAGAVLLFDLGVARVVSWVFGG
ncbi:MAG TPA: preprotein translocase subunit SecE [Actinomycetes bacterium]|jgi:preprotein translocase subunit SecE|nr:preprotein translocase subunit SecE [Actinomycetes bacterium]